MKPVGSRSNGHPEEQQKRDPIIPMTTSRVVSVSITVLTPLVKSVVTLSPSVTCSGVVTTPRSIVCHSCPRRIIFKVKYGYPGVTEISRRDEPCLVEKRESQYDPNKLDNKRIGT